MTTVREYIDRGGSMPGSPRYTGGSSTEKGDIPGSGGGSSGGSGSLPTKAEVRVTRSSRSNVFYYNPITDRQSTAETPFLDREAYLARQKTLTGTPQVNYSGLPEGISLREFPNYGQTLEDLGLKLKDQPLDLGIDWDNIQPGDISTPTLPGITDEFAAEKYQEMFPSSGGFSFPDLGKTGSSWLDNLKNSGLLIGAGILIALVLSKR